VIPKLATFVLVKNAFFFHFLLLGDGPYPQQTPETARFFLVSPEWRNDTPQEWGHCST